MINVAEIERTAAARLIIREVAKNTEPLRVLRENLLERGAISYEENRLLFRLEELGGFFNRANADCFNEEEVLE